MDMKTLTNEEIMANKQSRIPNTCGVYFLISGDDIVYVGRSKSIHRRIREHVSDKTKEFDSFCIMECEYYESRRLEIVYIGKFNPRYNKDLRIHRGIPRLRTTSIVSSNKRFIYNTYSIRTAVEDKNIAGALSRDDLINIQHLSDEYGVSKGQVFAHLIKKGLYGDIGLEEFFK